MTFWILNLNLTTYGWGYKIVENERKEKMEFVKNKIKERYIPDKKTPIYDFFKHKVDAPREGFYFYNEDGIELYFEELDNNWLKISGDDETSVRGYISDNSEKIVYTMKAYAEFIDKILGSNLSQELFNEIGTFYEKITIENASEWEFIRKLPILRNLQKSYDKLKEQVNETELNFRSKEKEKRDKFYATQKFRYNIKVKPKDTLLQLMESYEDQVATQQKNEEQEEINGNNGDGTEYRGG